MPASQFNEPIQVPHPGLGVVARGTWNGLAEDQHVEVMRVWVYQQQTGAACHGECEFPMGHGPAPLPWEVPTAKESNSPDVAAGPATAFAIALLVTKDVHGRPTAAEVIQWSQTLGVAELGQGDSDAEVIRDYREKESAEREPALT
jgi:hypothetical protein